MRKDFTFKCIYKRLFSSGTTIENIIILQCSCCLLTKNVKVYEPTVFENYIQDVVVDGKTIQLSIWDTAGNNKYKQMNCL